MLNQFGWTIKITHHLFIHTFFICCYDKQARVCTKTFTIFLSFVGIERGPNFASYFSPKIVVVQNVWEISMEKRTKFDQNSHQKRK